ncbi:DUF2975 domain-containing protein [Agaribacter marinus]|uniref:DUF2975 domain-containing protein n=1 Tax=Agaribacter marinus TaxID=1431249 RepID=A0AA37WLK3_9ALTE|nr:DUF2975 domain-containing protein [Agaribacter marinus]GLR72649.1 hypothetical protein GCM10007852_35570 [Agaribacter marinus]
MSIQHLSKLLYWLLLSPIAGLLCMWGYFLASIDSFQALAKQEVAYAIQWHTVDAWQLYLTCVIAMIPSVILVWGLFYLRKAFFAFQQNRIFEMTNVVHIKRFAISLILVAIAGTLANIFAGLILSIQHPSGQKILSIQFKSYDLSTLLIGLVFWLIAKILIQANDISKENQSFV